MGFIFGDPIEVRTAQVNGKDGKVISMLHYQYDNLSYTFGDSILAGVYFKPGEVLFQLDRVLDTVTVEKGKTVLEKYGIVATKDVSIMEHMKRQPDGNFDKRTALYGRDGVNNKIKSVELQSKSFRVVYNEELFELLYAAIDGEDGIISE